MFFQLALWKATSHFAQHFHDKTCYQVRDPWKNVEWLLLKPETTLLISWLCFELLQVPPYLILRFVSTWQSPCIEKQQHKSWYTLQGMV